MMPSCSKQDEGPELKLRIGVHTLVKHRSPYIYINNNYIVYVYIYMYISLSLYIYIYIYLDISCP